MNIGNLLIGNKYIRIIQICFHLLHIGAHISTNISAIKLHSFHQIKLGKHSLGLFHSDNAILGNLLHSIGNHISYSGISCGNAGNLGNLILALYLGALLLNALYRCIHSLANSLTKHDRVGTCLQVLHTLHHNSLCQNRCGGGSVSGNVIGLGSYFSNQLSAHILIRIL